MSQTRPLRPPTRRKPGGLAVGRVGARPATDGRVLRRCLLWLLVSSSLATTVSPLTPSSWSGRVLSSSSSSSLLRTDPCLPRGRAHITAGRPAVVSSWVSSSSSSTLLRAEPQRRGSPVTVARNDSVATRSDASTASMPPPFLVTLEGEDYSYSDAIQRTLAWVGASVLFGSVLWATLGARTGQEYFAGYLVEQSLSVDNLFVFLLLFDYFKVPLAYQDRVLNWGIYGAVVFRAIMIGLGAALLERFHAILLVFAGILVYSAAKVLVSAGTDDKDDEEEDDPSTNPIVQFSKSLFHSVDYYEGDRFFVEVDGVRAATPLFICMIAVEISDIVFAVDSIPAVFGVTTNPLVVFSSNIFAIMGLRSLYTVLSKAATDLVYLEPAVAVVLGFIGSKMILEYFGYCIPTSIALAVVGLLLGGGVWASLQVQSGGEEEEEAVELMDEKEPKAGTGGMT